MDGAEHQRDNTHVEGRIFCGKLFGDTAGNYDRDRRCPGGLNGKRSQVRFGFYGDHFSDRCGVEGEVDPGSSADLDHASGKPGDHLLPKGTCLGQRSLAQPREHP